MRSPAVPAATLALMVTLALPRAALAQDSTACSFDTAAHTRLDTLILGLAPGRENLSRDLRADYLAAAEAIREQFDRPSMLRLPFATRVVGRSKEPRSSFAPFGLHGLVRFQLDSTGRLTNDPIIVSSSSADIVESVVAAIQAADSAYAFPPPSKSVQRKNGEIMLRFVDTVRTKEPSVALMRLVIPAIVADGAPSVRDTTHPEPPDSRVKTSVSARVLLEFIIERDGSIEPGSIQILDTPNADFATQALQRLKTARFQPAKIGSCIVPALVRLPVDFNRYSITVPVQRGP